MFGAEGVGFEPTRPRKGPNGFQDRRIRPLCHPSFLCSTLPCGCAGRLIRLAG